MLHANAPLTERGRLRLARCVVDDEWPLRRAAERFQVAVTTAKRWAERYRAEGPAGMTDRSSRPRHSPNRTPRPVERRVLHLRTTKRLGPVRIGWRLGLPASTCHAILRRAGAARLAHLDRGTAEPIRRYEHDTPGDLIHVDVKKLGNIPDGGGCAPKAAPRANSTAPPRPDTPPTAEAVPGSATPTCTPRSTITPGWPTPKSTPTRPRKPPPPSGAAPTPGSPATASPSCGCCPTTAPATNPGSGTTPAPSSASRSRKPAPTDPRPTAKSNASTAPSPMNGPTPRHTPAKTPAAKPYPDSCTPTITTGTTPPSAAHPPAAFLTSLGRTTSSVA